MNKKNGFTLLELLITATLLSILAAFAIGSYRTSMFQARLEDYKNRTRAAAYAIQQYMEEGGSPANFDATMTVDVAIENNGPVARFFDKKYKTQAYSPEGWSVNLCTWKDDEGEVIGNCKNIGGEDTGSLTCLQWISDETAPERFKKEGRDGIVFCVSEIAEKQFIF